MGWGVPGQSFPGHQDMIPGQKKIIPGQKIKLIFLIEFCLI